jgi:hypothetical protein
MSGFMEELADMAHRTKSRFDAQFADMTELQAAWVRHLRIEEGMSWRGVAATCAEAWEGDWESNQIAGMAICERAARFFGEDYMTGEWNS